ncbi:MAG: hypothetical protein KGY76_07335 [Candidatus Thermoplasmatota archaeon]|nr:hypothetical protein [Candidatus Thermoplasmatota archaeon]
MLDEELVKGQKNIYYHNPRKEVIECFENAKGVASDNEDLQAALDRFLKELDGHDGKD